MSVISTASPVPAHPQDQRRPRRRVAVPTTVPGHPVPGRPVPGHPVPGGRGRAAAAVAARARAERHQLAVGHPRPRPHPPGAGGEPARSRRNRPGPRRYAPGCDLARFVAAFLDTLGVGPPLDVVGHSAGGAIALRLALADPQRIRTLTLVASSGLGRGVHPLIALDTLPMLGELAILFSRLPGGNLQRTLMSAALLFAQPWRVPGEFLTEAHALGRRPGQLEASTALARALFGRPRPARGPARPAPHPDHADPGRVGALRPGSARLSGKGCGGPAARRTAGDVPRLRAPAPHRATRPLRRRAQRLAHRTPRPRPERTVDPDRAP